MSRLSDEIGKRERFADVEQEAFVALQRTADLLARGIVPTLRPADLSPAQYNVLRILRGAGPRGLPCGEIIRRMITLVPDLTRLLDRLERRHLVDRQRGQDDRRVVTARITQRGVHLIAALDKPINDAHRAQFAKVAKQKLRTLLHILEELRNAEN